MVPDRGWGRGGGSITSNRIVDHDVESSVVRFPHKLSDCAQYYFMSEWLDMIGISISWCFAFDHENVM